MNLARIRRPFAACCIFLSAELTGCQSQHAMTAAPPGQTTVCAKCYDEIVKARSTGGPRGGLRTNKMIARHACEECRTEMSIYAEQDLLMIKCAKCAPEGVPCDRCRPPAGYAKRRG